MEAQAVVPIAVPQNLKGLTVAALQDRLNEILGEKNQQYKVPAAILLFVAYTSWKYRSPFGVLKFFREKTIRFLLAVKGSDLKSPVNKVIYGLVGLLTKLPASTFEYEEALPRLPVPSISDSISKFLTSVRPLLTAEEYESAFLKTQLFEAKDAGWLQRLLHLKAWNPSCPNYIDDWWLEVVYLMGRESLLSSNIAAFSKTHIADHYSDVLERASVLINAHARIKDWIDTETFRPKLVGGIPISMAMYKHAFGSTRLPGKDKDTLLYCGQTAQHAAVWYGSRFYRVNLRAPGGRLRSIGEIYSILLRIKQVENNQPASHRCAKDIHGLTALPRTRWWEAREHMIKSKQNERVLKMIETAAFCVCIDLDRDLKADDPETVRLMERTFLMKDKNVPYWMDKSYSIILDKFGCGGVTLEHGVADATVYGDIFEIATKIEHSTDFEFSSVKASSDSDLLSEETAIYDFEIDQSTAEAIDSAVDYLQLLSRTRDIRGYTFKTYGKNVPKKYKMSPDAYFQMALQVAYYMSTKSFSLTYESASTRLYRHGRTETIRSCSKESVKFVEALLDPAYDAKERVKRLRAAIQVQTNLMRNACFGEGFDRHILALRIIGHYMKADVPLFNDKSIKLEFMLSTSQTPGNQVLKDRDLKKYPENERFFFVAGGGFMAVADDGYGVCYAITEKAICMNISKRLPPTADGKADPVKDTDAFAANIERALLLMQSALEAAE